MCSGLKMATRAFAAITIFRQTDWRPRIRRTFGNYAGYIDNDGNYLSHYWYEWTHDSNGDGDFLTDEGVAGPGIVNGSDTGEEFPRPMDGLTRFQRGQAFGNQARNRVELLETGSGVNNWSLDEEGSLVNWDGKGAATWLQRNNQSSGISSRQPESHQLWHGDLYVFVARQIWSALCGLQPRLKICA